MISSTGLIGRKTIDTLRQGAHDVIVAARKACVNIVTGEGPKEALADAEAVIDLSDAPSSDPGAALPFFEASNPKLAISVAGSRRSRLSPEKAASRRPRSGIVVAPDATKN